MDKQIKEELKGYKIKEGTIINKYLTKELYLLNKYKYEYYKIKFWKYLISVCIQPVKWHKPDYKGTLVDFKMITTEEEVKEAGEELENAITQYTHLIKLESE